MERRDIIHLGKVWLKWTAIALVIALFFTTTHAFYAGKFERTTGEAEWLWTWNWISRQKPSAFFATRDFLLSGTDPYVEINVSADPMYTLFFNEVEVGGGRWEGSESIDVYDVTDLVIPGVNRIVIAVRAPDGVGGVLASVDTGPISRNIVVTNDEWRLSNEWSPELLLRDPADAFEPRVLGRPPFGRWNFPPERERERYEAGGYVLHPTSSSETNVALQKVKVVGGVAIAARDDVDATVFDFGQVSGRPRIHVAPGEMRVIRYLAVDDLAHLKAGTDPDALVVAQGETEVTEPATRHFRYFIALDPIESVEVLSDRP